MGRFINADETLYGGYNFFEYYLNNPVNLVDLKDNRPSNTRKHRSITPLFIGYQTVDILFISQKRMNL